mmetsp:Transcript_167044/g.536394  ORF Transcript_167044/g.536394 Transcript_167044/m.536394 type:complete len:336 (-) Transcript_167044:2940-3947(-)
MPSGRFAHPTRCLAHQDHRLYWAASSTMVASGASPPTPSRSTTADPANFAKRDELSARSSAGAPCSATAPSSRTTIRSASRTVARRCATTNIVRPRKCSRNVAWIRASVRPSMLEVASSSNTTRRCWSTPRATQRSCRWPRLRFAPRASIFPLRPPSSSASLERPTAAIAASDEVESARPSGSRLKASEPLQSTGSCGMTEIARRRSLSGTVRMSTPSIKMAPASSSTRRSAAANKLDLPLPVRPTRPTLVPAATSKVRPRKASGSPGRYLIETPRNCSAPCPGQACATTSSLPESSSRGSSSSKCCSRSTAMSWFSASTERRMQNCSLPRVSSA